MVVSVWLVWFWDDNTWKKGRYVVSLEKTPHRAWLSVDDNVRNWRCCDTLVDALLVDA